MHRRDYRRSDQSNKCHRLERRLKICRQFDDYRVENDGTLDHKHHYRFGYRRHILPHRRERHHRRSGVVAAIVFHLVAIIAFLFAGLNHFVTATRFTAVIEARVGVHPIAVITGFEARLVGF